MEYDNPWLYEGKPFGTEDIEDFYGFIYIITNAVNGRKYIGKKLFYASKTKMVKKKKKRYKAESDWKKYYGSSEEVKADIEKYGAENFKREILHLCKSKGECNYWEAHEQFERKVLLSEEYYNSWIQVKVHRSHVNKTKKKSTSTPE